ncbi:hypothetical protein D3C76_1187440 [compost metagenome]
MADAVDVRGIGDVMQGRQHTGRHVGVAPGTVGGIDDADETIVGVDHQAGMHIGCLGRQVRAVGGIPRQIRCGLIRRRRQHQRRVDDVAQQYRAHFQAGLVAALAPLQQIAARKAAGQAQAENALLVRRHVGEGQCHGAVGLAVP